MMIRKQPAILLLASALALPGCFGSSDDKGDNIGSPLTPRPAAVQDANTAGERKTPLPDPDRSDAKAVNPAESAPK